MADKNAQAEQTKNLHDQISLKNVHCDNMKNEIHKQKEYIDLLLSQQDTSNKKIETL